MRDLFGRQPDPLETQLVQRLRVPDFSLRSAQEGLDIVCQSSQDAVLAIGLVASAVEQLGDPTNPQSHPIARSFLRGLERYFVESGITIKSFYPYWIESRNLQAQATAADEACASFRHYQRTLPPGVLKPFDTVSIFVKTVEDVIRTGEKQQVLAIIPRSARQHPGYMEYAQQHLEIINMLANATQFSESFPDEERWRIPEKVIGMLREISKVRLPGLPDPYTKKLHGVSIADLARETDSAQFVTNALRLLQGFPAGDFFWQRVMDGLFFTHPRESHTLDSSFLSDTNLARNIWSLHQYFVDALVTPIISGNHPPNRTDATISTILRRLDKRNARAFMSTIVSQLFNGQHMARTLYPDLDIATTDNMSKLYQHINNIYGQELYVSERQVRNSIYNKAQQIQDELHRRINTPPHEPITAAIAELYRVLGRSNYDEMYSRWIREAFTDLPPIDEVLRTYKEGSAPGTMEKTAEGVYSVKFPEESVVHGQLGVLVMIVDTRQSTSGIYRFVLASNKVGPLDGAVTTDGEVLDIPIQDLPEFTHVRNEVKTLVRFLFEEVMSRRDEITDTKSTVKGAHNVLAQFLRGEEL